MVEVSPTVCHILSYSPASFIYTGKCNMSSLSVVLEARLSELEVRLLIMESKQQANEGYRRAQTAGAG